jgi:hypothetical protein
MLQEKKQSGLLRIIYWLWGVEVDSEVIRKRAVRVGQCAEFIRAKMCVECGKLARRQSYWCNDRLCPMCAERKSRAVAAQAMQVVQHLHGRPLLLTLTVRNVKGDQLGETIDGMLQAWSGVWKRRNVKRGVLSYARTLEITYNEKRGDYHPHIHAIVYVNDGDMLKASFWGDVWRDSMQLDYNPVIDVRPIVDQSGAVSEVSKYVAKVGKILALPHGTVDRVVRTLATVLHKRRLRTYGGEWAKVRKALDMVDEDKMTDEQIEALGDGLETMETPECCGSGMVDVVMVWTGMEYQVTLASDGSPVVVPEPEAVTQRKHN